MSTLPPGQVPTPPIQDARELVWDFLTDIDGGLSIYDDTGSKELLQGDIVLHEVDTYTDGDLTIAKDPYTKEKFGFTPKVIVGELPSEQTIMSLPPSWYMVNDVVFVRILTRDWMGNDRGFVLTGNVARSNLVNAVKKIIMANQYDPSGDGTWQWMRVLGKENADELTNAMQALYVTTLKIGLERFTQSV